MYLDAYFDAVSQLFERIRSAQRGAIVRAGEAIAASLAKRGALHVMDTGHMLRHEAFYRAGGLMAMVPFSYEMKIENPADHRKVEPDSALAADLEARSVALALDESKIRSGDVLIVNSNSGRTANVIEVALQCRTRDVFTIGISSAEQMARCPVAHPSGKKLFDVVDLGIDNCGPYGDALLEVKDNEKMCPGSGLAATYILWAIQAEAVERLQAMGINPSIFRSIHVSGREYVEKQRAAFLEKGI
ncbi:MAG: sugar isomerase domain-containing protein [Candidatus Hydrogenedentes bacterium]|nr:sugar isomerase domain-containing protein [Candidatus Hydrogenedentota bacterium]